MKNTRKWISQKVLFIALALSLSLNAGFLTVQVAANSEREVSHQYQYILQNLLNYMSSFYVDSVSQKVLLEGAVRGMLAASKDPYTRFLNAKEMKEFSSMEGGSKIGIGVELVIEAGEPVITAPMKGGPASRAGIRSGDVIVSVDGKKTRGLPIQKLAGIISGPKGTGVVIGVRRSGYPDEIKIEVVRGIFNLNYVNTNWFKQKKTGYIQLTHFFGANTGSIQAFENGVKSMIQKKARGIIIDLRDNTGGHLDMAAVLTGMFLKKGSVIVKAKGRYKPWNREVYSTELSAGKYINIPLVVLVNSSSASASEIMAGALQDYNRAKLVGVKTFGKASVQKIIRSLPGDTGAMITIQKYYTPKNRAIHGVGLKPDIIIESDEYNEDEKFYFFKLNKEKYFNSFVKKHPNYSQKLVEIFLNDLKKRNWNFRQKLALKLIKSRYHINSGSLDLQSDPQLRGALDLLSKN